MHRLIEQFFRFATVGAVGTLLHFGVLHGLVTWAGWPAWLASTLGALCGAIVNYALARTWVFRVQTPHRQAVPRFAAVLMLGMALNAGLMALLSDFLKIHHLVAQIAATGCVLVCNYVGHRTWTFSTSSHLPSRSRR
jgi:putative flippase GtrA